MLSFGDERPGGAAKVAIGVATVALLIITAGLASGGGAVWYGPLFVVVPLYAVFVLWVLWRRRVVFDAGRREVVVTRTLFGLALRRRVPFRVVRGVVSRGVYMRPRGGSPFEGTPEGDAAFIKFDLSLRRRWRGLHLDLVGSAGQAEDLARDIARMIGVPATRRDYTRRSDGLPVWQRGARAPIG
jgi:hypothetical protein